MNGKKYLVYLDILGFEKKAKEEAQKSNLEPEEVRDAYRKRIKRRLRTLRASKIILHSQEVSSDSWLLFTDSIWGAFKSVEENLKTKLDLEVAIGAKEFNESPAGEESIAFCNETISYLKDDILASYRKCYKDTHGKAVKQTFILLNEDAYKELGYKQMCYDEIYESIKGSEVYLIRQDKFERGSKVLGKIKSIENIEWKQGLILRFLLDCTDYTSSNWGDLKGWVRYWTAGLVEGAEIDIALDELAEIGFIEINSGSWKLTKKGKRCAEKIDYWFLRQAKEVIY